MVSKEIIRKSCKLAIENIIKEGATDVDLFNRAFEIDFLRNGKFAKVIEDKVCNSILQNNFNNLKIHKIGHVLIPKKSLSDFRKCALVDIYDEVVYLTLVLIVASEVEKMRINKSESRVHSYRHKHEDGRIFDHKYNYTSFRNEVSRKSRMRNHNIVVECDVSNYYDRLNIHRIESILRSNPKIDSDVIALINQLLLYWANRDSYGLPVGSNASRILAEAALVEVDNYLVSKKVDFCRFVDDFRIFCDDAFTAHSHLAILISCLNREGIFLNTQKTRIKDISKFESLDSELNESVDRNQKDNEVIKLIRGYSGIIPTKFRELTENQKSKLSQNDINQMITKAEKELLIEPTDLTDLIKTIVAKNDYNKFAFFPKILMKFPQFIPYFVDVLIKKGSEVSEESNILIQSEFTKWLKDPDTPEYIQIYLIRLYASPIFNNKRVLLETFRDLRRNSGDFVGRSLLESLEGKLSRGELLEIREYYKRADLWEGRQIIKLIKQELSEGEIRPFFRDILIHNNDLFIHQLIKPIE